MNFFKNNIFLFFISSLEVAQTQMPKLGNILSNYPVLGPNIFQVADPNKFLAECLLKSPLFKSDFLAIRRTHPDCWTLG